MAKAKNTKRKTPSRGKRSSSLHNSRRRASSSHFVSLVKKIIIAIICIVTLIMIILVACIPVLTPEHRVKSTISDLATDYYENYFYENLNFPSDTVLEKYRIYGLAPITLRDLLLYDNQKNISHRDSLITYCDENTTTVKFYMDPPYDRTSYHTEYTYSCNF